MAASSIIPEESQTDLDLLTWRSLLDEKKETFDECAAKSADELLVCIPLLLVAIGLIY